MSDFRVDVFMSWTPRITISLFQPDTCKTFVTDFYQRRQNRSASVGCLALCVCLSVCSITQKRMIPKCSNLVWRMTLGYPRNDVVWGWKVKGQGHRVNKCIFTLMPMLMQIWLTTAIRHGLELFECRPVFYAFLVTLCLYIPTKTVKRKMIPAQLMLQYIEPITSNKLIKRNHELLKNTMGIAVINES